MCKFLTPIIISMQVLLLIQYQGNLCFGYVCNRSPCCFRVLGCRNQPTLLMAEQPSTSSNEEAPIVDDKPRRSKRKRVSSVARRLRFRLPSFLNRDKMRSPIESAAQELPPNNQTLLAEDVRSSIDSAAQEMLPNNQTPIAEEVRSSIESAAQEMPPNNQTLLAEDVRSSVESAAQEMPPNNQTELTEDVEEQTLAPTLEDEAITFSRQSTAADHVDLSGTWRPIVTSEFKKEYDSYLFNCSQSFMFRKVVINGIGLQKEIIRQLDGGVNLEILATNPVGDWNRTLVSSDELNPRNFTVTDPDGDIVQVMAWWEENGTKHKSLLQEKPNVQGGVFETVRYLESENVLVCDSYFYPSPSASSQFKYGNVVWKFQRVE